MRKILHAGMVLAAAGALSLGAAGAASATATHTTTAHPAASTAKAGTMVSDPAQPNSTFYCQYGYLCVHEHLYSTGAWKWYSYQACNYWHPIHGTPTWYKNNQTSGTRGYFKYPGGWNWATKVPPAGDRPLHYPYDSPKLTQPTEVTPCLT